MQDPVIFNLKSTVHDSDLIKEDQVEMKQ